MRIRPMNEADTRAVCDRGWLSHHPPAFRDEVLRRSVARTYAAGEAFYHLGDPVGGIYGLVSGLMTVTSAPGMALPRMIHVGAPGTWTGEGPFLSGAPRRLTLRAAGESRVLHLPLEAMEAMAERDPSAARRFGLIPLINIDTLLRVIHDLLLKDPQRRIGAVLLRAAAGGTPLPVTQSEIGEMSCTTRKQVNFALRRFETEGWVERGYRSVTLRNAAAMRAFVAAEDSA